MENNRKRNFWPYIIIIAVILAAALSFLFLLLPNLSGKKPGVVKQTSEYAEGETALKSPESYEELLNAIKNHIPEDSFSYITATEELWIEDAAAPEEAAEIPVESAPLSAENSNAAPDYSSTNTRTEPVDESDIVKTDGRYIYTLFPETSEFTISDTEDPMQLTYQGSLTDSDTDQCKEFFISDDRLYLLGYHETYSYDAEAEGGKWDGSSFLYTYDIKDRHAPMKTSEYTQSGQFLTARISGSNLYLFSDYYDYDPDINSIPVFNGNKAACSDIYYGKYFNQANYYCIGKIDLSDPGACASSKAILAAAGDFYVSDSSIFLVSSDWINQETDSYYETNIVSIGYDGSALEGKAIGSVPGYINDSFSVDAYNGYLRLVTTQEEYHAQPASDTTPFTNNQTDIVPASSGESTALWILDENMNLISSLPNIQKDETVRSARFIGDTVYFVTFRNTDPLFAADLSNPAEPKMLGAIDLTGFSNYLHPWSDHLLLGIGYEADLNGSITGGKISMFDISDPAHVKETDRYIFGKEISMLGSDYSYKAVLADPEKNLIGFASQGYRYDPGAQFEGDTATYYLFSYDETNGFELKLEESLYEDNYWYDYFEEEPAEDAAETPTVPLEEENIFAAKKRSDALKESESVDSLRTAAPSDLIASLREQIPENGYLYCSIRNIRGLYIGDQFYIVHPGAAVYRYGLDAMKQTGTLPLFRPAAES